MIRTCPTHQLQWNDQTVPGCPLCREMAIRDIRREAKAEMRHTCGACREPFDNTEKWWAMHGNFCPDCTRSRLRPNVTRERAPRKAVIRGKMAEAFVELYDKIPTALDLEQFKGFYRMRKKAEAFDEENQ
jgi:hypothetical protein